MIGIIPVQSIKKTPKLLKKKLKLIIFSCDLSSVSHCERAVKLRKESLWKLIDDLVTVFGMTEPLSHKLFQECTPTQMHPEELKRLISCYPNGLERIKEVYRQDILQIDNKNTRDRKAVGVVRMKLKDYNE